MEGFGIAIERLSIAIESFGIAIEPFGIAIESLSVAIPCDRMRLAKAESVIFLRILRLVWPALPN